MAYGPAVLKRCEHCDKEYMCPNHRAHKSQYCSNMCANGAHKFKRIEYTCVRCSVKFLSLPDHGVERKFCSRDCFSANSIKPIDKRCLHCDRVFTAVSTSTAKSEDGRRLLCSAKCRIEYNTAKAYQPKEKICASCEKPFYPTCAHRAISQHNCSAACRDKYFSGANHHGFKGGTYVATSAGHRMRLFPRPKFVGKYTADHRVLLGKYLGRQLTRAETVIHINNQGLDNRLSNLYVCASMSDYCKRRQGSLPWPDKSNVKQLKEQGE